MPAEASTPANESAEVLTFETVGGKASKAKTWALRESVVSEMREAFPALDVVAECRKALAWTRAKPANRKTADGMQSFLFGWLSRTQNRGAAVPQNGHGRRPAKGDSEREMFARIAAEEGIS